MQGQFPRTCPLRTATSPAASPTGIELDGRGRFAAAPSPLRPWGTAGFGYDPVFFVPELKKTFAQLTAEEKNAISHRGNALRAFAGQLKAYLEQKTNQILE